LWRPAPAHSIVTTWLIACRDFISLSASFLGACTRPPIATV
jgi:hypothetical protein